MDYYNARAEKDAFDAAHGERVQWQGTFYYIDGAARSNEAISEMRPPPEDEFQRLTMILYFHRAKLSRAVLAFDNYKEQLMHQACGNGEETFQLKELQREVARCSKAVEKAQAALDDTAVGRARKAMREEHHEQAARQAAWLSTLNHIRI